jgi:hypothetical protein
MACTGSYQAQVACYAALFGSRLGAKYSTGYKAFAASHPQLSAQQAAVGYEAQITLSGIATGLGAALSGTGKAQTQVASGAAAGAEAIGAEFSPGGSSAACALHFPGVAGVGSFCIISKTALRALLGGLVLGGAGVIGITAAVVLAAYGLGHTKAGQALQQSGATVARAGAAVGIGG